MDLTTFKSVCVFIFNFMSQILNFHLPFYLDIAGTRLYMTPLSIISGVLVLRLIIYIFKSFFGFGLSQVNLTVREKYSVKAYKSKIAKSKNKNGGVKNNGK